MPARYRRRPGSVHRDFGDVVLVLAPGADGPTVLRGGAVLVWDAAAEPFTVADLAADVRVDQPAVQAAVDDLVACGALERAAP